MGCISWQVTRIDSNPKVTITKDGNCEVGISRIFSAVKAFVTYIRILWISISYTRTPMNVEVSYDRNINVSVGLVCSISISDEVEMWWCDGWKALWNNNLKILWRGESV